MGLSFLHIISPSPSYLLTLSTSCSLTPNFTIRTAPLKISHPSSLVLIDSCTFTPPSAFISYLCTLNSVLYFFIPNHFSWSSLLSPSSHLFLYSSSLTSFSVYSQLLSNSSCLCPKFTRFDLKQSGDDILCQRWKLTVYAPGLLDNR